MWSQKGREGITNQSVVREKLLDFFNETNMSKYKFVKRSGFDKYNLRYCPEGGLRRARKQHNENM